ncbi:MAG: hypothetical protein E7286_03350 [Lachnospiraceae bacterium]|nr:hypothetical protein [Lachnospiraceae bacterium]
MEFLLFFASLIVFMGILFLREGLQAKKKEKLFIQSLYECYGEKPKKEIKPERFERIPSYYERHIQPGQIDDITWNDLNMDEIYKRMNYTFSASGEEYLYYTLRNAGNDKANLGHLEEVVRFFEENADERVKIQYLMHQLGHSGKYSLYDYMENLDYLGERSNKKHILMNLLFLPALILLPFQFTLGLMSLLGLIIYNILTYFKEKGEIEPYIVSFSYVLRLFTICEKLKKINVPVCKEEWELLEKHCVPLRKMKKGSYVVFSMNNSIHSGNPLDMLLDYIRMVFHIDLIKFNNMLADLRFHVKDVDVLIAQVGFLETAISIDAFRHSLPEYCVPEFNGIKAGKTDVGISFSIENAYHPLMEDAVKNSISTQNGVLITGSNASGKSTFLKTVAVNAIMAQTIHTCTASAYQAPCFQIATSMALRDNMEGGESYYIVEIKALKRILDMAAREDCGTLKDRPVLCFVDEVLRGTNTVERIAASTQILKSLAGKKILCFAATHDIELTELLKDDFANYHFEEDIIDGDIVFNYKLLTGKATTRNAIRLLSLMGYDGQIIEMASKQAEKFMATGNWSHE